MSPSPPAPRAAGSGQGLQSRRAIGRALYGLLIAIVRSERRDLSLTSLSTLSTLEQWGPRRITDLAAGEGVTQPSMTALVSALERSGLVARMADPTDKRAALVTLTATGTEYIRNRRRTGVEGFARLIEELPPEESEALGAAITALEHLHLLKERQRETRLDRPGSRRSP